MSVVFEQVLILFIFALTGFVLCKSKLVNADKTQLLSTLEVYVFLPCVAFNTFSQRFTVAYLQEKYPVLLISLCLLILLVIGSKLLAHIMVKDSYQRLVYRYSLTIPNYGYIGYALAQSVFGSDTLLDMMIFTLPMAVYTHSAGYAMLTNRNSGKELLKKVLNPTIIATFLGAIVGITGLTVPGLLTDAVQKAAACMSPISMLLIGMVISQYNLKELISHKPAYLICALRLVLIPAAAFALLKLTHLDLAIAPAILTYAMPCGANTIVFAKITGQDCKTGASFTLISTVLSLITIPLCIHFFIG